MRGKITKDIKVFISYAWESKDNIEWVLRLASQLKSDGIDVKIDKWELVAGDQVPQFMETSVSQSDFVICVCTPGFKKRFDNREGGVGYESNVITAEVLNNNNDRKFIPILKSGKSTDSLPIWASGKFYIDFTTANKIANSSAYKELLNTILKNYDTGPQKGEGPLVENLTEDYWNESAVIELDIGSIDAANAHSFRLIIDGKSIGNINGGDSIQYKTAPKKTRIEFEYTYWQIGTRMGTGNRKNKYGRDFDLKIGKNKFSFSVEKGRFISIGLAAIVYNKNDKFYLRRI